MADEKTYELKDLIIDACDTYDSDDYNDMKEGYDNDDIIHEIADNAVPIYYYDIGQYAAHNSWLMTHKPDINTDGNAHDQIQANIYCAIYDGLVEHIEEKEEEDEEDKK